MKKIGIITIIDYNNYGNRLQNYALQTILLKNNKKVYTIKNFVRTNKKNNFIKNYLILNLKLAQTMIQNFIRKKRYKNFKRFNKCINFYKKFITFKNACIIDKKFDYFICGSDQIWNLNFRKSTYIDMLCFTKAQKKISYAASFGTNSIPIDFTIKAQEALNDFKAISVREDRGKEIVEELTGRKDVEVLVDPTMLLTAEEWDKVSKKPKMLKTDKYILNYFLGDLSDERRKEIDRVAKENNCEVINILDKNSPFYECGPSEFLYLEKNAFLICTDSFHSCVFAILYNTPFLVFDREQKNLVSMNSRLDTLLSKFKLENRRCNGKITKKDLTCDYKEAYKILEKERIKADKFLRKALDIKDSD